MAASTIVTALTGNNNDLDFTAARDSVVFNTVAIEYLDPAGASKSLAVTIKRGAKDGVSGTVISVSLATDGSSVITTTAAQVKAALLGTKAANVLTSDNTAPSDGDTVVVGGQTYVFKTTLTASTTKNQVLINSTADAALLNLSRAINGTGTPGTDYGSLTLVNGLVTASATVTSHTITLTARSAGTEFNLIPTTETSAHLSFADVTLGGASATPGVDPTGGVKNVQYFFASIANHAGNDGTGVVTAMTATSFSGSTHEPTTGYASAAAAKAEGWVFSGTVSSGAIVKPTPQNLHYGAAETFYEAKLRGLVNLGGQEVATQADSAAHLLIACELLVAQLARKGRLFDWACAPYLDPSTTQV